MAEISYADTVSRGLSSSNVIETGNPADAERFLSMLDRHIARTGAPPRQTAADGGYASRANLAAAKARGVADVGLPQEVRHRHYRDGQEPLGLPSSAQLPRRHRGGHLLLQARVRRRPLHLARTGALQGLHLVRRGGAQPGAVRPAQTGLAAPDCTPMKNRQSRTPSTARLPIPVQFAATNARNACR